MSDHLVVPDYMKGIDIPVKIDGECAFMRDLSENNHMGMYNLITTKSALSLWAKGIKPNRHFKLKNVKRYFGITGSAKVLHAKLRYIYEIVVNTDKSRKGE